MSNRPLVLTLVPAILLEPTQAPTPALIRVLQELIFLAQHLTLLVPTPPMLRISSTLALTLTATAARLLAVTVPTVKFVLDEVKIRTGIMAVQDLHFNVLMISRQLF